MSQRLPPSSESIWDVSDHDFRIQAYQRSELPRWVLTWTSPTSLASHQEALTLESLREVLFPYLFESGNEVQVQVQGSFARPLSTLASKKSSQGSHFAFWEKLGAWLRRLHHVPAPSGFGSLNQSNRYQTFNAMMAAEFDSLGQRLQMLDSEALKEQAIELLAELRHELSSFHPHGRSTWTLGRITTERILVDPATSRVEGASDLSHIGLRPPEFDLANLRYHNLFGGQPQAETAFWKGYQAVLTSDFERRIYYFQRLLSLQTLLLLPPD